jgi:hypothetical protein
MTTAVNNAAAGMYQLLCAGGCQLAAAIKVPACCICEVQQNWLCHKQQAYCDRLGDETNEPAKDHI